MIIVSSIYWFLVALSIAIFEIELEGKYGWAEKSATWSRRYEIPKVFRMFSGTRVLTGYHLFLNIFLLLFMHSTFFINQEFSITAELTLLATYLTWTLFWDFLWFIMNPYYGWKMFSPKAVWWFGEEKWILNKLPLKYFVQTFIAFVLVGTATIMTGDSSYVYDQAILVLIFVILTILSHYFLRPVFHKYYWKLHKRVD